MRSLLPLLAALFIASIPVHAASSLAGESSAFLRSHAESPVKWMTWGDAAFARAKEEQKPVFLAIGSFTSEFSRAMARQTFSNAETAAFLNENFVCVLVDAKEQPQLAALYQSYIQGVKQLRGLPLNLWLTPELKPFDGANYLPPTEEWGKEGFNTVSKRAAAGWQADPAAQRAKAEEAVARLTETQPTELSEAVDDAAIQALLTAAKEAWTARFDAANGGFGDAPKYPEPELLRWLLLDPTTREMALTTLRAFVNGGLRDPLDGGFFRYTIDPEMRQPYFQKTLADQARFALALLDAAKVSGDAALGEAARGALRYALTQLRMTDGDFFAAEDATLETLTPSYFWKASEISDALGAAAAKEFSSAYGVTAEGNIPADTFAGVPGGSNLLRQTSPPADPAVEKSLADSRAKLLAIRLQRAAPLKESNATSGAHGLLLQALARAGVQLKDTQLLEAAKKQVAFIRDQLVLPDGSLLRVAERTVAAVPEDYAFVISGLEAYRTTSKDSAVDALIKSLVSGFHTEFWNEKAGCYYSIGSTAGPAYWARVIAPAPLPADLPSAEAALLISLESREPTATGLQGDVVPALRRTVAARVRDAEEIGRGDMLLALALTAADNK